MMDKATNRGGTSRPTFSKEVSDHLKLLHRRDNWHGWLAILGDWLQIMLAWTLAMKFVTTVPVKIGIYVVAILIVSSRQRALEHLLHEASHGNVFKNQRLNVWASLFFATYPNFTSLIEYRKSHLLHHNDLGHDHDPDLMHYVRLNIDKLPVNRVRFVVYYVIWNGFRISFLQLGEHLRRIGGYFQEPILHRVLRYVFIITVFPIVGYAFGWHNLVLLWFIPRLFVLPIIRYFGEMSKHAVVIRNTDFLLMTRNRFPGLLERYLTSAHNDNCHLVHHLYPGIPFYNLNRAHRVLMRDAAYRTAHHCVGYTRLMQKSQPTITAELTDVYDVL